MLQLTAGEGQIRLDMSGKPEFDHWEWVDYQTPVNQIIDFKREVYEDALQQLRGVWQQKFQLSAER